MSEFLEYLMYVSEDRCQAVRVWSSGEVELMLRESPGDVWGPPIILKPEKVG